MEIRLNEVASRAFLDLLDNPPEPNKALTEAARIYRDEYDRRQKALDSVQRGLEQAHLGQFAKSSPDLDADAEFVSGIPDDQ